MHRALEQTPELSRELPRIWKPTTPTTTTAFKFNYNHLAMAREHRTPLRRVSHGSLSALARSTGTDNGPTGLDFLEPAFTEFADEAATMHRNVARMGDLYDTLETFNESFCSFLYALNMNAYTVEWPQVC